MIRNFNNEPPTQFKKVLAEKIQPQPSSTIALSPTLPARRDVDIGLVITDYTNSTGELSSLEKVFNGKITTISIYKQFGLPTNNMIDPLDFSYLKSHNITLLIAWEPWDPRQGENQSIDYLSKITSGDEDNYIKQFANAVKSYGAPVTIRFAHEMNGNWYPWGQRPTDYIHAYQRVVTLFRNEGITNVNWMWSINASPLNNISSYYPGDDFVDSIGIDGFNFGTTQSQSTWVTFSQIFSPAYNYVANHYNKPIYISEVASSEFGGNKASWINDMFANLSNLAKIRGVIWFDLLKETDWRINSSASSFKAFEQNIL